MRSSNPEYRLQKTMDIIKLAMDINQHQFLSVMVDYSGYVYDEVEVLAYQVEPFSSVLRLRTDFTIDPKLVMGRYATAEQVIDALQQVKIALDANCLEVAA